MAKDKDYSAFQVEDLLADECFQDWVLHPDKDPAAKALWDRLANGQTALVAHIAVARGVLDAVRFKEQFPDEAAVEASLSHNLLKISRRESDAADQKHLGRQYFLKRLLRPRFSIAAAIAGLAIGIAVLISYLLKPEMIRVETVYGETKTVILPDSSQVILNAHSSIRYPRQWKAGKDRHLSLVGEAYFNVRHLNRDPALIRPGERFIVHIGPVDVTVLGTRFDVRQSGHRSEITLEQGRIQLMLKKTKKQFVMHPGQRIVYDASSGQIDSTEVQPADYISWTHHELVLKGETLHQIGQLLSRYYGVQIQLETERLGKTKMEGTILLDSLPEVIFALSTAMDLDIERRGDTLFVHKKHP